MDQRELDERIRDYYEDQFDESARLTTRSAQGPLEHQRIQELIAAHLPEGRVIDVGGGAGVHARSLLDRGHQVILVDPVRGHVHSAAQRGVDARVGDARSLPFTADSFDAALLLGPLYHLADRADRPRRSARPHGWCDPAAGCSRQASRDSSDSVSSRWA
ncbi:class I SAM-dependent methyltransferase [Microbacterium sp. NPDC077057]|uniref:class I SAM-dependent methyltransferase n=1 Tax=unclassified Microbacterium TaxID=2609290 RepID=UPI0034405233